MRRACMVVGPIMWLTFPVWFYYWLTSGCHVLIYIYAVMSFMIIMILSSVYALVGWEK